MTVVPREPHAARTIRQRTLSSPQVWYAGGVFLILAMAALRLASAFFLPVFASALLALLLAPPVRWLTKRRVPIGLAAGIVILAMVGVVGMTLFTLARPAAAWISRAPETMEQAQEKIQKVIAPIYSLQATAAKVQQVTASPVSGEKPKTQVEVAPAGMLSRVSGTTIGVFGAVSTVLFLTFFLLAAGERFSEKLSDIMPERHRRETIAALRDMQSQMSTYLSTSVLIRSGLGLATWGVLKLVGLPNPGLWGATAAVLNFIPYLGSLAMLIIIAVASLVTFDDTHHVLLAVGGFFIVSILEGNVVTPMLLGHRLPLNAVAIFVGLLFWGWIWGITGAVLAVPLMVMIKVISDRVKALEPLGVILGS
jgi:predicted PurR-regulated permease PerM